MIGLIVLAVAAAYLIIWLVVVVGTYRVAKRRGAPPKKAWLAAGIACLIMYLIPFWDWLPTVAAHRYYCWKDSGLTIYKTLDQWKAENPGVAETLRWKSIADATTDLATKTRTVFLNQRFIWETCDRILLFLPVIVREERIVDRKTAGVIARHVDVRTGYGNPMATGDWRGWKGWLNLGPCDGPGRPSYTASGKFGEMVNAAQKLGVHQ